MYLIQFNAHPKTYLLGATQRNPTLPFLYVGFLMLR